MKNQSTYVKQPNSYLAGFETAQWNLSRLMEEQKDIRREKPIAAKVFVPVPFKVYRSK